MWGEAGVSGFTLPVDGEMPGRQSHVLPFPDMKDSEQILTAAVLSLTRLGQTLSVAHREPEALRVDFLLFKLFLLKMIKI